jgi:hypothetical protein
VSRSDYLKRPIYNPLYIARKKHEIVAMVLANNPPNIYFRRNLVGPKHVSSVSATAGPMTRFPRHHLATRVGFPRRGFPPPCRRAL